MHKIIYFIIFLYLTIFTPLSAQENAFVLIDVSGNPKDLTKPQRVTIQMRNEAEDLVRQLIAGQYDATRFNANWKLSGNTDTRIQDIVNGNGRPLLSRGGHFLMMPFGTKNSYLKFKINKINNYPADFDTYWRPPSSYIDQNTFGEIAKAKAADIAIDANLSDYYLIVISGLGEDTDSRTSLYTPLEMEYMDNYRSAVIQNSLAIFRYKELSRDFKIEVSYMDLKKMRGNQSNTAGTTQIITSNNVDKQDLEIVTPQGSRKEPFDLNNQRLLVSWTCLGCSDSTEYVVRVTNLDNKKNAQVKKVVGRLNHSFTLEEDGSYQVSVSGGSGLSDRQFFELSTGSGGGFGVFLILALLGVAGYFAYKQFIVGKGGQRGTASTSEDDLFSDPPTGKSQNSGGQSGTGAGSNSGSDNGGYF